MAKGIREERPSSASTDGVVGRVLDDRQPESSVTRPPTPSLRLEEQLSDPRSDQIAYKLTLENVSTSPIRLLSVEARVPIGASLLQVTDTSLAEASTQKAELLDGLNRLLTQFLWVASEDFRRAWVEKQKELTREIFSVTGLPSFYLNMIFSPRSYQLRMKREFDAFAYKVTSAADGRSAFARWMGVGGEQDAIRSLFDAKLEQLAHIEERMTETDRPGLTTIEAGSTFAATYVLKFTRGILEARKYQVGFHAVYESHRAGDARSISSATNVQIAPHPLSLSLVAVIAAILGVLLRISLAGAENPFKEILRIAASGQLLVGPTVALIFFNAYEYTSVGKDFKMSLSWRSALLIGAVSGLAQDRILAALKTLIGVQ